MDTSYATPGEYLAAAIERARPVLQHRHCPVEGISLDVVDSLIDSSADDEDPLEVLALRNLRVALLSLQENTIPSGNALERERQFIQLYQRILDNAKADRNQVFALAIEVKAVQILGLRCFILCEGGEVSVSSVVDRAIAEISAQPMVIDAAKELRGDDPVFRLDGRFPRAEVDAHDLPALLTSPGRTALLMRNLPSGGRKVWVFDHLEELAADAPATARAAARRQFWQYIASLKDISGFRLFGFTGQGDMREVHVNTQEAVFVCRTRETPEQLQAAMHSRDWNRLGRLVFDIGTHAK